MRSWSLLLTFVVLQWLTCSATAAPWQIAVFEADATPPLGSPVAYAPATKIVDPLSARGVVLLTDREPIVLCAVDWIGISNGGLDAWRGGLAEAAGTTVDRVAVHALHQHDGPRCDFTAEALLAERGLGGKHFDVPFARRTIDRVGQAVRKAMESPRPASHLGVGGAKVEKVASNRRILGEDGKVKIVRWSRTTNPEAIAAPEGLIDQYVAILTFYNQDEPIAALSYYATHPQSYYGQGEVSADFVGMARRAREEATSVPHIHFNGAGGNITAGKYNDGSPKMRPILAQRLAEGMKAAWNALVRRPIATSDIAWRTEDVTLPLAAHLDEEALLATLDDKQADADQRSTSADKLAWLRRVRAGRKVTLACLRLDDVYVMHMPGELFIEYQLAAQQMRPDDVVCMAAYGEYGCGYIGTEIAYSQGGYETSDRASNVAPEVERVLMTGMEKLLK